MSSRAVKFRSSLAEMHHCIFIVLSLSTLVRLCRTLAADSLGIWTPPHPPARGHFASSENGSCISSPVPDNIVLTRLRHDYSAASASDGKALFQTPLHGIKWTERLWEEKTDMRQRNTTARYGFHKEWSDMVSRSCKHRVWLQTGRLNPPTPPLVVMFGSCVF